MRPVVLVSLILMARPGLVLQETPPLHVLIGKADVDALGGWPLDRKWFGVASQNLVAQGARRIFIDVAFPKADLSHPESDAFFFDVVRSNESIYVLTDTPSVETDSVRFLGSHRIGSDRVFFAFSNGIATYRGYVQVPPGPGPGPTLLQMIEPAATLRRELLIPIGESDEEDDVVSFLSVLRDSPSAAGRDVVVTVDYPGVTSYLALSGTSVATGELQVRAATAIREGRYRLLMQPWMFIVLILAVAIPLVALRNRPLTASLVAVAGFFVAYLLLHAGRVLVPDPWIAVLAFPVGVLAWTGLRNVGSSDPTSSSETAPRLEATGEAAELSELRYRLGFYEDVETVEPPDSNAITAAAGIIHAAGSPIASLLRKAAGVAESTVPVLVLGESGVGKELFARFIHDRSAVSGKAFVATNCASFNDNLIESELFGYEAGAFTGAAKRKIGRFEQADGGTLFLDEIAETNQSVQVKLLRVLQEGTFERVGGTETVRANVRVIAATNQDLPKAIAEGRLREDLYYRLNGYTLNIPPLRQRPGDIELLFRSFASSSAPTIKASDALIQWLKSQTWRGNVRELRAATERAALNAQLNQRSFFLPSDFDLDDAKAMTAREDASLSVRILDGLRAHQFKHRSLSAVADDLSIHRITVTEYFRGWVIRQMVDQGFNVDRICDTLIGSGQTENPTAFRKRVSDYMTTIRRRIDRGVRAGESDDEIRLGRFKNTPSEFDDDLNRLIASLRQQTLAR